MSSNLEGSSTTTLAVQGQGRVISNFSLTHYAAAKQFAGQVCAIEKANEGQPFGNFWQEISIFWSASIMSATAALEALVNELYVHDGNPLHDSIGDFDEYFWGKKGLERKPILVKFETALDTLRVDPLNTDSDHYKSTETLIGLRNYLVHFKPLWDEDRRNEGLEAALDGLFEPSPFPDEGADFITKKCVSGSCAVWAVRTVKIFVGEFANASGLDPKKLAAFD